MIVLNVMAILGKSILVKQLMHVGLSRIDRAANRSFDVTKLILLLLHLLDLNLLDILSDLLSKKVAKLIADLMAIVELPSQLVRVIAFTNEYVLVTPFSDLDRQSQNLFPFSGVCGRRCSCGRTLVVLALSESHLISSLLGSSTKWEIVEIIQIAWQAKGLKELLFKLVL